MIKHIQLRQKELITYLKIC